MEPVVLLVRLFDRHGDQIGTQQHQMPREDLLPHLTSAEKLSEFVRDRLLPQVTRATIRAYLDAVPLEHRDAALEGVGKVELILDSEGPQPVSWALELPSAEELAAAGELDEE